MAKGWSFGGLVNALKTPAFTEFGTAVGATMQVGVFNIGKATIPLLRSLDLSAYPFVVGEALFINKDNISNMPSDLKFTTGSSIRISVITASDVGLTLFMEDSTGLTYTVARRIKSDAVEWNVVQLLTAYGGKTDVSGDMAVVGALTAGGKFTANSSADVLGALSASSSLTVAGEAHLQGQTIIGPAGTAPANDNVMLEVAGEINSIRGISIGSPGSGNFAGSNPSINIGDSDSGFATGGDGMIDMYLNDALAAHYDGPAKRAQFNLEIVSGQANAYRIKNGDYGMIHRFDGSTYYMLLTAKGDQDGTWNSLRPFNFNATTGDVNMSHNVRVGGNLNVGGAVYSGAAFMNTGGNLYGTTWGGYLSTWINNQINGVSNNSKSCAKWVRTGAQTNFGSTGTQRIISAGWVMIGLNSTNGQQNSSINLIGGRLQVYKDNGGWVDSSY